MSKRYRIAHFDEIEPTQCPCGEVRRAFVDDPDGIVSFHVVDIAADSKVHYHKRLTEIYYVLEGRGQIELDGERFDVRPGSVVLIKPLCRHRAVGRLKTITVPVPAFDASDEWFD